MGLIKNIIGGIFGLIGGIFGGVAKLLGLGKKGEFYMELEEGNPSAPAAQPEAPAPSAPMAKASEKAAVTPAKAAAAAKPKATPVAVSADKPLVTADPQAATKAAAAERNFATDYLVNRQINNAPRRRPGPSVSPFKEMARSIGKKSPSMG